MDQQELAESYRSLFLIRRTEEEICRVYPSDNVKSPVHLSIGQEAVSVAVCGQMDIDDVLFGTYRGHAGYLAKGGDLRAMWAELYGKADGCARGKAGSMHLVDPAVNVIGTSAIVASGIPNAVGYALAMKMKKRPNVVVCFHGEGATDEGVYAESINFAALHDLPILFVCENNEYAIYSHVDVRVAGPGIAARVEASGIPTSSVDDGDFFSMRDAAAEALTAVRNGGGPRFLQIATMRWKDHVGPTEDRHHSYRDETALDAAIANDQVRRVGEMLDDQTRTQIENEVEHAIGDAIDFAERSALPEPEEIYTHVFAY